MVILLDKKNGNKARTRYYNYEDIGPFVSVFQSLLETHRHLVEIENTPYMSKVLQESKCVITKS